MAVLNVLQAIFPFVFPIAWIVPTAVLFFRFRAKQATYLRRIPPIDRYQTLDMYTPWIGNNPPGTYRRIWQVQTQPQSDVELEALRREMWRSYRVVVLWMFLFPFVTFGVVFLLYAVGLLPTH